MYFPSRKDLGHGLLFLALILLGVCIVMYNTESYSRAIAGDLGVLGYLLVTMIVVFISLYIWIWFQTGYKVDHGEIKIISGLFRKTVNIEEIQKMRTSNVSLLVIHPFGPALSTKRIEINYGEHFDTINISPVNRKEFVEILLVENPEIQIEANVIQS